MYPVPKVYTVARVVRPIKDGVKVVKPITDKTKVVRVGGLPGQAGAAGQNGAAIPIIRQAGQTLSGHRVVWIAGDDKGYYASSDDPTSSRMIAGVTTGAASADTPVTIVGAGEIEESSWNWAVGSPVWLGLNGALTQAVPTSGTQVQVGIPLSATKLLIRVGEPIALEG